MLLEYKINWETITDSPIFQALRGLNLIDETELRNVKLREDYRALRQKYKSPQAVEELVKKYGISDKTIRNIIYHPKSNLSNIPLVFL